MGQCISLITTYHYVPTIFLMMIRTSSSHFVSIDMICHGDVGGCDVHANICSGSPTHLSQSLCSTSIEFICIYNGSAEGARCNNLSHECDSDPISDVLKRGRRSVSTATHLLPRSMLLNMSTAEEFDLLARMVETPLALMTKIAKEHPSPS